MPSSISTRSIANVTVSFGTFANLEAKIFAAAREEGSGLNLVAKDANGVYVKPTQQYAVAGKVIPWNDLERGYEMGDENFVVISKAELDSTKATSSKQLDITSFIPLTEVDPLFYDKSYFLVPNVDKKDKSANPKAVVNYALLLRVMEVNGLVGQAKLEMRGKEHNVIVRATAGRLMLHTLFNSNEVRSIDIQRPTFAVTDEMVMVGTTLVSQLAGHFDPTALTSSDSVKLEALIARKVAEAKGNPVPSETAAPTNAADDLMAALLASLKANGVKVPA
jgi:DNA end-binding protein Ku